MTPVELSRTVLRAMRHAVDAGELSLVSVPEKAGVERPRPGGCGDYATNVALQVARAAGRTPRQVAEVLSPRLAAEPGIAGVDITGAGFLNITLAEAPSVALVREVRSRGVRYGHLPDTGELAQLHTPHDLRAVVLADSVRRILRSQGILVRVTSDAAPEREWVDILGVRVDGYGTPPEPLPTLRPVPAPAGSDPLRLGRDAARWALLHPAAHDHPRIAPGAGPAQGGSDPHLVQRETNPLFRVQYAHARSRALTRNAAELGFEAAPGDLGDLAPGDRDLAPSGRHAAHAAQGDLGSPAASGDRSSSARRGRSAAPGDPAPGDPARSSRPAAPGDPGGPALSDRSAAPGSPVTPGDLGGPAPGSRSAAPDAPTPPDHPLLDHIAAHPPVLAAAARHRAPDRLARHLVGTADALLAYQHTVLPLGDEKPSAAHRARLALAEAAGTVLAGGLSLLGISAPEYL
ncbi:ArgS-related anticodon-binding protein NrtL [Streptomyces sp. NPDC003032]